METTFLVAVLSHYGVNLLLAQINIKMHSLTMLFVASLLFSVKGYTFIDLKTSYIKYKQWPAHQYGDLTFRFKTSSPYGLLLYSDNSKSKVSTSQNFIKLQLTKGELEFTVQHGSEDYKSKKSVTIGKNLNDLTWHEVNITRNERETVIVLNKLIEKYLQNDGEYDELDLNSDIYLGGVSDQLATNIVDGAVLAMPRFVGCVEDFRFKGKNNFGVWEEFDNQTLSSEGVKDGCLDACTTNTCENNGHCINYFTSAKCDCVGTGYFGSNCSKERDSIQLDGHGYIDVELPDPLKSTIENTIIMRFKTRSDGLLLVAYSKSDHIMIELYHGIVRMSIDLGGGYHLLEIADILFNDGGWHLVSLKRNGREFALTVDKKYTLKKVTPGLFSKFNIQDLFIGGHPVLDTIVNSKSKNNFSGCLQEVLFNEIDIVYKTLNTESSRFQMVGNIKNGCDVVKSKVLSSRDSAGPMVSKSGSVDVPVQPYFTPIKPYEVNDHITAQYAPKFIHQKSSKKLSKQIITWIIIGIIVGSIALIVAIAILVHGYKKRYSTIVLSKKDRNSNLLNNYKSSQDTIVIYKANQGLLQPRLV
ncbi:neurexin-3 isoform X2 [Hydra vulgaris]|nr:neurexin-3 isoform X2 [Hydra vulgaris]